MNRRKFLSTITAAGAAAIAAPYILPSGTLFARTASRRVNHVVFLLFAGGVRNIESVHQNEGGNLMPALLFGSPSTIPGLDAVPTSPLAAPLQQYGTLFKEFRYAAGPTGHYNGHTVAMTGVYTATDVNLRVNPTYPTVFEYYRKHNSPTQTAMNAWWVSNNLGPYPALNYSKYPDYGAAFGANFLAPTQLMFSQGYKNIDSMVAFNDEEEKSAALLRGFLNQNFQRQDLSDALGVVNTPEDALRIRNFVSDLLKRAYNGLFNQPLGMNNASNDVYNIAFAEELIKEIKPELLVVNMTDVDACHTNFTDYCNYLRKADYAAAHLWNFIQNTPGMADDTVLIIAPEHGRNKEHNSLVDAYGKYALDHTNDPTSREIFCMVVGPPSVVKQNQVVGTPQQPLGQSIDVVPTIARILGFDAGIPSGLLSGNFLEAAFV